MTEHEFQWVMTTEMKAPFCFAGNELLKLSLVHGEREVAKENLVTTWGESSLLNLTHSDDIASQKPCGWYSERKYTLEQSQNW